MKLFLQKFEKSRVLISPEWVCLFPPKKSAEIDAPIWKETTLWISQTFQK